MKILERIFFRFYQFYSKIEEDKAMVFYFSAFAISFITSFYSLLALALVYSFTGIKLISVSGKSLTIFFFVIIALCLFFFFMNKTQLLEIPKKMDSAYKVIDLFVLGFITFGIISLFLGGIVLTN